MTGSDTWTITQTPGGQEILAPVQLARLFEDPRIILWRDLPERQNCFLDLPASPRLHIKRYKPPHGKDVYAEVAAIALLAAAGIATVPLLAWGTHPDGRAFLVTADLVGYQAADRVLATSPQPAILDRIADLAAHLHGQHLHHQDLYLCHFFVCPAIDNPGVEAPLHLIDPGRVAKLPAFPFNIRWLVKDLAQLTYSARQAGLSSQHIRALHHRYFAHDLPCPKWLIRLFLPLKVAAIAKHDQRIRAARPGRIVSIPSSLDPKC